MTILAAFLIVLALATGADAQIFGGALTTGGRPSTPVSPGQPQCSVATNQTSIDVPVSFAGINRTAIAIVGFNGFAPILNTVASLAQGFTLFGQVRQNGLDLSVWQLIAPIPGTELVTARFSAEVGAASLCVITFENTNQTEPMKNGVPSFGAAGPAALSTTSAVGNLAMAAFLSANNFIVSSDDLVLVYSNPGSQIVTRIGVKTGAPTASITYGLSGVNAWNALIFDIVKN